MEVAVHDSIGFHFDPALIADYVADEGHDARVVGDDDSLAGVDCVTTFGHREGFLETPWVHCIRTGVDEFPFDRYRETDTALTNSEGIHGESVGETVMGFMLTFARRLHRYRDRQADSHWEPEPYEAAFTLAGERVCVVGVGTLGQGVATRAGAMGMDVVGVRRRPRPAPGVREVVTPDRLLDAVEDARFVVLCVPLVEATRGMIDTGVFEAMRDDAYLINVARGPVVDREALVEALETDAIAGAALDAHHEEPLPEDSPLWGFDNAVVTPHAAALVDRYHQLTGDLLLANADRYESGRELYDRVA
jgi:D-2-hydroxyacid dehydrogenase (NADP+)